MKKYLVLLIFLSGMAFAQGNQNNYGSVAYVNSAPSGSCPTGAQIQLVKSTGLLYSCQSNTWAQVGGGNTSSTGLTASTAGEPTEGNGSAAISPMAFFFDASNATFLNASGVNGDVCLAINKAIIAAINAGIGKVIWPLSGFWACNTNMWQAVGGVSPGAATIELEFTATGKSAATTTALIMSVAQYTPYIGANIHSPQAATSGLTQGTVWVLCGPELTAAGIYSGGVCTFNDGGGTQRMVNQPATTNVTFNIAHGPFAAGNYMFAVGLQGEGISTDAFPAGMGWNRDGGTTNFQGIAVSCGGNTGCFDIYDLNGDENTKLRDFRVSGAASSSSPWAGVFFDRTECCFNQIGKGWARPSIEHLNMAGLGLTAANNQAYGIVMLGSDITVVTTALGSCGGTLATLKMWVTSVNTSGVITGVQNDPNNNGGGTCVTPTFAVYGAANCWNSATGNIAGGTVAGCTAGSGSNNTAGNFGLNTTATLAAVVANGYLIGATIGGPPVGYGTSFITGGTEFDWIDIAGAPGFNMAEGVYIDGVGRQSTKHVHCINMSGACVDYGELNLTAGGEIGPTDAPSAVPAVQLGPAIDGNQFVLPIFRQSGQHLVDNHHLPPLTLTATNYPQGIPGYTPSGLFVPGAVGSFGNPFSTNAGTTSTIGIATTVIKMWGITVPLPIPLNSITYLTGATVDSTTDTYDFAICQGVNSSYCMPIVDTGPVAGTTAFANINTITTLPWVNAYNGWAVGDIIPAGRYYILATCLTVGGTVCGTGTAILQSSAASGAGSMVTWFTPDTSSSTAAPSGIFSSSGFAFPVATPAGNSFIEGSIPLFILH